MNPKVDDKKRRCTLIYVLNVVLLEVPYVTLLRIWLHGFDGS
jgi:hypothetical protein